MAITNHDRVGKGLDLLRAGLALFVEREFKAKHGDAWADEVQDILRDTRLGLTRGDPLQDTAVLLVLMDPKLGRGLSSRAGQSRA